MNPRIILDRTFERDLGGFDYKSIVCEIMDTKWGPIAFTMHGVCLSNGVEFRWVHEMGDEITMTDSEILDAQKILDRIKK